MGGASRSSLSRAQQRRRDVGPGLWRWRRAAAAARGLTRPNNRGTAGRQHGFCVRAARAPLRLWSRITPRTSSKSPAMFARTRTSASKHSRTFARGSARRHTCESRGLVAVRSKTPETPGAPIPSAADTRTPEGFGALSGVRRGSPAHGEPGSTTDTTHTQSVGEWHRTLARETTRARTSPCPCAPVLWPWTLPQLLSPCAPRLCTLGLHRRPLPWSNLGLVCASYKLS